MYHDKPHRSHALECIMSSSNGVNIYDIEATHTQDNDNDNGTVYLSP